MPTNLAIDDSLIAEAQKLGRHRTKIETVTAALDEYVQHRKQQRILSLFGTIDFNGTYDYKRERRRERNIFTTHRDFKTYAKVLPLKLHSPRRPSGK